MPLTILSTPSDVEFLIVEMGANHQGEIEFLCNIANPDLGIITNIGKAHLEGFGGIEGVKRGKTELYRYLSTYGGTIIYNGNDEVLTSLIPQSIEELMKYENVEIEKVNPSIELIVDGHRYSSHLFGEYNVTNIICAVTLGKFLDISHESMIEAIQDYQPTNNRSEITTFRGATVIKDAYNANPSSVQLSLKNFAESYSNNSIAILGDMLELGEDSIEEHKEIINLLEELELNDIILIGPIFQSLKSSFPSFNSVNEAMTYFNQLDLDGKNVLIKGSRGLKLELLLES